MSNEGHNQLDPSHGAPPDPAKQLDDLIAYGIAERTTSTDPLSAIPMARPIGLPGMEADSGVPDMATGGAVMVMEDAAGQQRSWWRGSVILRPILELVLLVPVLVAGAVGAYLAGMVLQPEDARWPLMATNLGMAVTSLAAVTIMLRLAGQGGESIGWTSRRLGQNVLIGLGALVVFYAVLYSALLAAAVAYPKLLDGAPTAQKAIERALPPLPMAQVMLLMIVTVLWEEVVFRGFLLTRLQSIFKTWWLAVPVGSLLFAVVHSYEGVLAMVMIGFLALVMSLLFVWRRSLVPCLVLHWLHNVGTILLLKAVSTTWQ